MGNTLKRKKAFLKKEEENSCGIAFCIKLNVQEFTVN
jgi:hypothetical protein